MTTYRELLARTKAEISEVDAPGAQALDSALWVDIREVDEWQQGHLPGAVHVPRGNLESRIERVAPDRTGRSFSTAPSGTAPRSRRRRSATSATRTSTPSPAGSKTGSATGSRSSMPRTLSPEKRARYSPSSADSRDRRGGPAEAARRARAPDRRGRARVAGLALPRGGRRRDARDHRRRHRRRDEPAAPDRPLARHARHAEGGVREAHDRARSTPT